MRKFLIPAIGVAIAFSPVVIPWMFASAPAHAQAKAKAAAKAPAKKSPMCAIRGDDRYQESWATAYGCWGTPPALPPAIVAGSSPGQAIGPPPAPAAAAKGKKK